MVGASSYLLTLTSLSVLTRSPAPEHCVVCCHWLSCVVGGQAGWGWAGLLGPQTFSLFLPTNSSYRG